MKILEERTRRFREKLEGLGRERLLELVKEQDIDLYNNVKRIEWVFENKMAHIRGKDGEPILSRLLTNAELALLIDEPFAPLQELTDLGISVAMQRDIHVSRDAVMWAKHNLDEHPRAYQVLMIRDPSLRKVFRMGRRSGKTFSMSLILLHYAWTTPDGRCIIVTPMKTQGGLIYEEIMRFIKKNPAIEDEVKRNVTSPQYEINFKNGSSIRFFSSGTKSGGRSDVTRGQEAHIIVLDEMDYMNPEDLIALYAMLMATQENQPDKQMIGASTPTGLQQVFYDWCTDPESGFSSFWFPAYCFPPSTKITMGDGTLRNIEDIQKGDLVLTEDGPHMVTRTFEREFDGEIRHLKWYGNSSGLQVTGEHPFSAASRVRRQKQFEWSWVDAQDILVNTRRNLSSGHWLRSPVLKQENHDPFNVLQICPDLVRHEDGYLYPNRKRGRKYSNGIPDYLDQNDDLATVIGWYLAEGSLGAYSAHVNAYRAIEFTLSHTEMCEAQDLKLAIKRLGFGNLSITEYGSVLRCRLNNGALAQFLQEMCGVGSKTKKLHAQIMQSSLEFQSGVLSAYAKGDGWEKSPGNYVIRTSSEHLAKQIQIITARLGHYSSISVIPECTMSISDKYGIYKTSPSWAIEYSTNIRSHLGKVKIGENDWGLLPKSNTAQPYSGKVFNFEVETTNSYIAEGLLVHNCNPLFTKENELEFRKQYGEMEYRHEIEADWGEPSDGVYPRRYIDKAFTYGKWAYEAQSHADKQSFCVMGVDWDKYGATPNIVLLRVHDSQHKNKKVRGKIKLEYREALPKDDFSLLNAVERIKQLNAIFNPKHIYVDRGFGEVQIELLHRAGLDDPLTGLTGKVRGVAFRESIEIWDPASYQRVKKEAKPFMIHNLRQYLEAEKLMISEDDEDLFKQLISYIVTIRPSGTPHFEAAGSAQDHIHDALILAGLAIAENYGEFSELDVATESYAVSSAAFQPLVMIGNGDHEMYELEKEKAEAKWGSASASPIYISRAGSSRAKSGARPFKRKSF